MIDDADGFGSGRRAGHQAARFSITTRHGQGSAWTRWTATLGARWGEFRPDLQGVYFDVCPEWSQLAYAIPRESPPHLARLRHGELLIRSYSRIGQAVVMPATTRPGIDDGGRRRGCCGCGTPLLYLSPSQRRSLRITSPSSAPGLGQRIRRPQDFPHTVKARARREDSSSNKSPSIGYLYEVVVRFLIPGHSNNFNGRQ